MKKQVIALAGLPGSGKTTARTKEKKLRDLPFVDIADIYAEHEYISSGAAFQKLLRKAESILATTDSVVLEAAFCDWQRVSMEAMCACKNYNFRYREFHTPAEECVKRVKKQYKNEKDKAKVKQYYEHRLEILSWYL